MYVLKHSGSNTAGLAVNAGLTGRLGAFSQNEHLRNDVYSTYQALTACSHIRTPNVPPKAVD